MKASYNKQQYAENKQTLSQKLISTSCGHNHGNDSDNIDTDQQWRWWYYFIMCREAGEVLLNINSSLASASSVIVLLCCDASGCRLPANQLLSWLLRVRMESLSINRPTDKPTPVLFIKSVLMNASINSTNHVQGIWVSLVNRLTINKTYIRKFVEIGCMLSSVRPKSVSRPTGVCWLTEKINSMNWLPVNWFRVFLLLLLNIFFIVLF